MSPNNNSSVRESSTSNKTKQIFNDSIKLENQEIFQLRIIVTKHPSEPCYEFYTDIFHMVLIECKDPSHIVIPPSKSQSNDDTITKEDYSNYSNTLNQSKTRFGWERE
jgi:hypothetical protein